MQAHRELREQVLAANLEIVRAGLVVLTFGNASLLQLLQNPGTHMHEHTYRR